MADRQTPALAWLRERGPGPFGYRELAAATGMTRDQAMIACLALETRGVIHHVQWIWNYGTDRFELRSVRP